MKSERNFKDSDSFMTKEDGRIAFCTARKTWADIAKHGLPLDDYFFFQTHSPTISFDFKPTFHRCKKEKEGLNDEDRCESCKKPFDTITFQRKNKDCKEAVCSSCIYPSKIQISEMSKNLNNHLEEINALLYMLDYAPSDYEVSVSWIFPSLRFVMNNWKIDIGVYEMYKLRKISNAWPLDDLNLINVLEVVTILRKLQHELKLTIRDIFVKSMFPIFA
jgi:hypothetical protein